jgi:predicted PurR-regulated permease PerM
MSHPVVITFLILAIVGAMALAAEVLKPLALSVLLAFALTPVSEFFEKRARLPRAAAGALTVLLTLGAIGGLGYVVGRQLTALARQLDDPRYKENLREKLKVFRPDERSALEHARRVAAEVSRQLTTEPVKGRPEAMDVRVVQEPTFRERLQTAVGPYLEFLGVGSFVMILVLFLMTNREDLRDRVVRLFGHSRVSLTTRTMDEIVHRISRYLATLAAVNSGFGLVIGLGLWTIGVPLAALWGSLAAVLRFIPYIGPAVGFALPLLFSVAAFPDWSHPLLVVALFAAVETALNSALEPVIYGKTTGVSALGLLVAAMFWTWLWGVMGILLSTPLTVCLAVLGKYVPSLGVFATVLGEDAELDHDVRFYQRLVALDHDGAVDVVDEALKTRPRAEVFDGILIPALSRAERDAARGFLEDSELAFIGRVVAEIVDDLEGVPEVTLETIAGVAVAPGPPPVLLGVAPPNSSDAVVLRMLDVLLEPAGLDLEPLADAVTPLALADRVQERSPALVVLSHLPPAGRAGARYQVRRLRARFPDLPIVVGRWGATDRVAEESERLSAAGASRVALSLADARDSILSRFTKRDEPAVEPGHGPPLGAAARAPAKGVKVGS